MLTRYLIGGRTIADEDEAIQAALHHAYAKRERPLCLCQKPPLEMYIASVDGRYYIKRMPNSGRLHEPQCVSYEPPPELSGLGHVLGSAITDDAKDGGTILRVNFSLARRPARATIGQGGAVEDSVKADSNRLTLRGTLHYLLHQAGFNRWSPRMAGKRSWTLVRRHLIAAAHGKQVKGQSLPELLYVPEAWTKSQADAIKARRGQVVGKIAPSAEGNRSLMLCIGECKAIQQSPFGYKLLVKHAPDFPILFPQVMNQRIEKRFQMELSLKDTMPEAHLLFIATFSLNVARAAHLEEISFVIATKDWIPFDTPDEATLIEQLVNQQRYFVKGLRFNLHRDEPLATAILLDASARETALYVVPAEASERYREGIEELKATSPLPHWTWNLGESTDVPELPPTEPAPYRGADKRGETCLIPAVEAS